MRTQLGATVVPDDVLKYFKGERSKGDPWRTSTVEEMIVAVCEMYTVELKPGAFVYHVEIQATDDPMDSEKKVTDNPMEFLAEFLGTGTPGDDFFKKRSSVSPDQLRELLVRLSSKIDKGKIGPRSLARVIRRAILTTDMDSVHRIFNAAIKFAKSRLDFETKDIERLKAEMMEKGWEVKVGTDDRDFPSLTVNVGGIYKAEVTVDHMSWNYSFKINGSELADKGITDDPVVAFEEFAHSDEVKSVKKELKAQKEERQVERTNQSTPNSKKQPSPSPSGATFLPSEDVEAQQEAS
jgi:hypothetical protein